MTSEEAVAAMIQALTAAGLPFMLAGSLSSNYYGVPRSTKDADLVVEFGTRSVREIMPFLDSSFRLDPHITFESITATTRYILDVPEIPFRIELFRLSNDAHDRERFVRRRPVVIPELNVTAWLPSPEDVVITKLRWAEHANRSKDRDDVRDVITIQKDSLDWEYIEGWCRLHGTLALLQEIRATA